MNGAGDDPRDAYLQQALRHAPDADVAPPPALTEAIRREARAAAPAAVSPAALPQRRGTPPSGRAWVAALEAVWDWLVQPRIATGFASLMVATLAGVMWWGEPIDPALEERRQAPAAPAPDPAGPEIAAPTPHPAAGTEPRRTAESARPSATATATATATAPALAAAADPAPPPELAKRRAEAAPVPARQAAEPVQRADPAAPKRKETARVAAAKSAGADTRADVRADGHASSPTKSLADSRADSPADSRAGTPPAAARNHPLAVAEAPAPTAAPAPPAAAAPVVAPPAAADVRPGSGAAPRAESGTDNKASAVAHDAARERTVAATGAPAGRAEFKREGAGLQQQSLRPAPTAARALTRLRSEIAASPAPWQWRWRDAPARAVDAGLLDWLARADAAAGDAWVPDARVGAVDAVGTAPAASGPPDAAGGTLLLLRDGVVHSRLQPGADGLRLLSPSAGLLRAALPAATAFDLRSALDALAR